MLTKEVITTTVFQIDLPNLKGTLTEKEAVDLLDALIGELGVEVEPVQSTLDELFEEDAELPGAQN